MKNYHIISQTSNSSFSLALSAVSAEYPNIHMKCKIRSPPCWYLSHRTNLELLKSSELFIMFIGIVNLCCFFHLSQFFTYPPNRDTITFWSQLGQGEIIQFGYYHVGSLTVPFSFGQYWFSRKKNKWKLYVSQMLCNFEFSFIKAWKRAGADWKMKAWPYLWVSIIYAIPFLHF